MQTYAWTATGMRESNTAPTLFVKSHEIPRTMDLALESKLATIINYLTELRSGRQHKREDVMKSMLDDPQLCEWLDRMKHTRQVNHTRFAGSPSPNKG